MYIHTHIYIHVCMYVFIEQAGSKEPQEASPDAWMNTKEYQLWVYAVNNPGVGGLDAIRNNVIYVYVHM